MKNLKLGISALALTIASTVFAQTTTNKWLVGVGAHGMNHVAAGGGLSTLFDNLTGKPLWTMNNFTVTPPLSKLTVARNLNKYLVIDWQTSVGNVDNKRIGMDKEFFLMTGLGLQFKINGLWNEESWFDPYIRLGGNYMRHDYSGVTFPVTDVWGQTYNGYSSDESYTQRRSDTFTVAGGIGSNFWVTKNFGIGLQGDYVGTPIDKSDIANFWQASASLLFRFGHVEPVEQDRDGDGILDKDDACPDEAGPVENNGCPWPDTDGDGILDKDDNCPEVAGPVENNGCPWPDTDGDGLTDNVDKCPNEAGPRENNGCPWPDTDGDGILDKDDACPYEKGIYNSDPTKNGCPPKVIIDKEFESIMFDFNKATLKPESNGGLDNAADIIKSLPNTNFVIVGMTDAKGAAAYNLNLSRQRAASVVAALEQRGVDPNVIKSIGIGSQEATQPATASDEERQVDRKVVVRIISSVEEWNNYKKSDLPAPKKSTKKKK
ncbi:MAG: OmpA family protein [Flavobacteriaceae bacterium]|jgi:outer membrane protein OmpA-like peptidoglycan-associated protein|nr:OmpA family protein [Flavobacteriaceae bacterium]